MSSAVADLYANFLRRKVEFRLFNGNPGPVEANYDSETYVIPGREQFHADKKTKERWPEPGVLPVKGTAGKVTKKKGKIVDEADKVTAQQIVEFMVGPDGITGKLGPSGVRCLLPDGDQDGRNDMIRQDAIETADKKRYADALGTIRAHENGNRKKEEFGQKPIAPNSATQAAYALVAQLDAEGAAVSAFSCPKCAQPLKTTEDVRAHINTIHKALAPGLLKDAGLSVEAPVLPKSEDSGPGPMGEVLGEMPVRRGPGRPPTVRA